MDIKRALLGPIIMFAILIVWGFVLKRDIKIGGLDKSFYYGKTSRRKMFYRTEAIEICYNIVLKIAVLLCVGMLGFVIELFLNTKGIELTKGQILEKFGEIMCSTWFSLLGILVIFASFHKKQWMTFSATDIMEHYNVRMKMLKMFFMAGIVEFHYFLIWAINTISSSEIYFGLEVVAIMYFMIYVCDFVKICYMLIEIFFGERLDGIFLEKLYRELSYKPMREFSGKCSDAIICAYIEYLCDSFCNYSKKVKIGRATQVIFSSNLYYDRKNLRYESLKKKCAIGFATITAILSVVIIFYWRLVSQKNFLQVEEWNGYGGEIAIIVFCCMLFFILIKKFDCLAMPLIIIIFGRCAYEFEFSEKNRRYVTISPFFERRKYFKYICCIKNIIVFSYMAIKAEKEKKVKVTENRGNVAQLIIEECEARVDKAPDIEIFVAIIGYLYYIICQKEMKNIHIDTKYLDLSKAVIRDVERGIPEVTSERYMKYLKKLNQ